MSIVLGIDTGGTYTDGVIINLETKEILSATKSPTTHHDLIIGIRETIQKLNYDQTDQIAYVALSTTLATNAIVENRGCRVGLLILGFTPDRQLPECECRILPGTIDIEGNETEPLNLEMIKIAVESLRDKVDAVAISGIFSVRNPIHENIVRDIVRDTLGLPTVTAHELASVLGYHERTTTAVLNARLLSVIDELMVAVKEALVEKGIRAPLMIVKGDGSLMNESIARERPIETILSGPAASIIGTTYLNDAPNGLVLDMGGTTTDIAVLRNGRPRLDKEGATVGGWKTRVLAVEANTFGLGGDSRIFFDKNNAKRLTVGPRRCWPVSRICKEYPYYLNELRDQVLAPIGLVHFEQPEGLLLLRKPDEYMELSALQSKLIEVLEEGPHTVRVLGQMLGVNPNFIVVDKLLEHGVLGSVGFTPTDLLHLSGEYVIGDVEGAQVAASLMAVDHKYGSVEEMVQDYRNAINDKLCRSILGSALDYEKANISQNDETFSYFFNNTIWRKKASVFHNQFVLDMPIVGIGAPVKAWLPQGSEKFSTEAIFPVHNDVANAVGAAAGKVMEICSILVQNREASGVMIFAPWGREQLTPEEAEESDMIQLMEVAIQRAIEKGKEYVIRRLGQQETGGYRLLVDRDDAKLGTGFADNRQVFLESRIDVIAVGVPEWQMRAGDDTVMFSAYHKGCVSIHD